MAHLVKTKRTLPDELPTGLEKAELESVNLFTIFALTLPSPGRVEEEINKISPHLTPKISPLGIRVNGKFRMTLFSCPVTGKM